MANDPVKKQRVLEAVLDQPGRQVVIGDDGYRPLVGRLNLDGVVSATELKNALESLAFKKGQSPLVRHCRSGQKVYRQRNLISR